MKKVLGKPRCGTVLSEGMTAIVPYLVQSKAPFRSARMSSDVDKTHCFRSSIACSGDRRDCADKGRLAAYAGRIQVVCSGLSGRKFILDIGKAFSLKNLRQGHEALLMIQVPGLHFKFRIPAHGAVSGPKALQIEGALGGKHSLSRPKADNAGWYMYNRKNQFPFRWLTPRLLKLVCTVQHNTENLSYTDDRLNRLNFLLKLHAAPVRRVHYNLRPSGRASDLPHGPVPCARKELSGVGKPLALWDDSSMSGTAPLGGFGGSEADDKTPWGKSPRVLGDRKAMQERRPFSSSANSVAQAMQDVVRMR